MASDEQLRIGVEVVNLEKAISGMGKLIESAESSIAAFQKLSKADKNFSILSNDIKQISNIIKDYTSVIKSASAASKIMVQSQLDISKVSKNTADANLINARAITESSKASDIDANAKLREAQTIKVLEQAQTQALSTQIKELQLKREEIRLSEAVKLAKEKESKAAMRGGAYNQLKNELSQYTTVLKNAIAAGNINEITLERMAGKYRRLTSELTAVNGKFVQLTGETKNTDTATQLLGRSFAYFLGNLASTALQNSIRTMIDFGKAISIAGVQLDGLRNTMMAATGGWQTGITEMKWLLNMSNNLGVSFEDVSDSYAKFMTSFTRSGGTIAESRKIFEDLSTAMVTLHLPTEQMKNVYVALEQMANKGTVQAEELKRQLGNVLPGAFELAAESMGILPAQLMDMMKKGEVVSKDFLPKFAQRVKDVLGQGIGIAVDQYQANMNRLTTANSLFKMELGQGLNAAILPFIKGLTLVSQQSVNLVHFFNENAAAAAALKAILIPLTVIVGKYAFAIAGSATSFAIAQIAGTSFFKSIIAGATGVNIAFGGLPIVIGAVVTAIAGLSFYMADVNKKFSDVTPYIGMRGQIVEITKSITALDSKTKEGQETLIEYKKQFPQLSEYLINTGKSFKDLTNEELKHIAILGVHDAKMKVMSERTAELASWQNTLSAIWGVSWDNIRKTTSWVGENIIRTIDFIKNAIKILIKGIGDTTISMAKGLNGIGSLAVDAGDKLGIIGQPLKDWGEQTKFISSGMLNFGENVNNAGNKIKEVGKAIKNWGANTAFGIDVSNKKIEIANNNAIKKLQEINKGAVWTVKALQQAQAATKGLTGADGDDKKKSGKVDTEWDKFNKEISQIEELIKIRKLNGQSIDDLVPKYIRLKAKQEEINNSVQQLTEKGESAWDLFGKEINQMEEQIRIRKLNGQSIDDLVPPYVRLKKQQDDINKSIQDLMLPVSEIADKWKQLEKTLKDSEDTYKYMLSNSNAYTEAEIDKQRSLMQGLKINVQYNKAVEDSADLMGMTSRAANQLTDTLVDSLFTTLGEGETVWSRFKDAGIAAMKALATEWIKSQSVMLSKGFQAGWNIQNLYDKATGGSSTLSDKFSSGIVGLIQGAKRQPLPGTMDEPTKLKGMIDATLAVNNFTSASSSLASTAANNLTPALNNTISLISSIISPATNAATAFDKTTLGAIGMTALSAATNTMLAASAAATPVFTAMSASIAAIGTAASASAIAMAQLAVATASAQAGIGAPAAAAATSAAIIGSNTSLLASYTALNALSSGAKIIPHARGGIVSSPTMFPMQGGNIALTGEAGTEVIAPARRMSNGDVGIGAVAPNVTINNYTNTAVEVIKRPDNETEIKITELNAMLSSSRTNKGMGAAQSRMQKNGRRIG